MDGSSILGAMQSLQLGAQAVNGILTLKVGSEVQSKAIELNTQILSAQSHILAIQSDYAEAIDEIRSLKEKIASMKRMQNEKENYTLQEVDDGAFAYTLKPSVETNDPAHWLCVSCFDSGHKSLFQSQGRSEFQLEKIFECPRCNSKLKTHSRRRIERMTSEEFEKQGKLQ